MNPSVDELEAESEARRADRHIQLDLLLVYEDLPTALRAKRAVDHVLDRSDADANCRMHAWNFELFRDPTCRERAMEEAVAADIVVVSIHGNHRLPAEISNHLKHWIGLKRGSASALVISLDSDAKLFTAENPELTELCFAASRSGMKVLLHAGEPLDPGSNMIATAASKTNRPAIIPATGQGRATRPYRGSEGISHWGINE